MLLNNSIISKRRSPLLEKEEERAIAEFTTLSCICEFLRRNSGSVLIENSLQITITTNYSQNFNTFSNNLVKNDVVHQRYPSQTRNKLSIGAPQIRKLGEMLTFFTKSFDKAIACIYTLLKIIINL